MSVPLKITSYNWPVENFQNTAKIINCDDRTAYTRIDGRDFGVGCKWNNKTSQWDNCDCVVRADGTTSGPNCQYGAYGIAEKRRSRSSCLVAPSLAYDGTYPKVQSRWTTSKSGRKTCGFDGCSYNSGSGEFSCKGFC